MFHKSTPIIFLFFLLGAAVIIFPGCGTSDINNQESVTSGTSTGSGSSGSGGAPANVTIFAGNNTIALNATTTITLIITDSSGKRTDASIILTSSRGGKFNGSNATLIGNTQGGIFIADYLGSVSGDDEITATVAGTILKGTTIITIL